MPNIIVLKAFKFAHFGYQVEEFEPSDVPRETTQECHSEAVREGWAIDADAAAREAAEREAAERAAREQANRGATESAESSGASSSKSDGGERKAKAHPVAPENKGE